MNLLPLRNCTFYANYVSIVLFHLTQWKITEHVPENLKSEKNLMTALHDSFELKK